MDLTSLTAIPPCGETGFLRHGEQLEALRTLLPAPGGATLLRRPLDA